MGNKYLDLDGLKVLVSEINKKLDNKAPKKCPYISTIGKSFRENDITNPYLRRWVGGNLLVITFKKSVPTYIYIMINELLANISKVGTVDRTITLCVKNGLIQSFYRLKKIDRGTRNSMEAVTLWFTNSDTIYPNWLDFITSKKYYLEKAPSGQYVRKYKCNRKKFEVYDTEKNGIIFDHVSVYGKFKDRLKGTRFARYNKLYITYLQIGVKPIDYKYYLYKEDKLCPRRRDFMGVLELPFCTSEKKDIIPFFTSDEITLDELKELIISSNRFIYDSSLYEKWGNTLKLIENNIDKTNYINSRGFQGYIELYNYKKALSAIFHTSNRSDSET